MVFGKKQQKLIEGVALFSEYEFLSFLVERNNATMCAEKGKFVFVLLAVSFVLNESFV